jgi:hypothetical protein
MKTISSILYFVVMTGMSLLFTLNGLGPDTWQWWAQFFGIFLAHILGMLRMVDDE